MVINDCVVKYCPFFKEKMKTNAVRASSVSLQDFVMKIWKESLCERTIFVYAGGHNYYSREIFSPRNKFLTDICFAIKNNFFTHDFQN